MKIKVPEKEGGKWRILWKGHSMSFRKADTLFNGMRRRLLRTDLKEKLAIVVNYGNHTFNETLSSNDARYLLYTLGCFLEDYLSRETISRTEKDYFGFITPLTPSKKEVIINQWGIWPQ
jgi:hypothetical protein